MRTLILNTLTIHSKKFIKYLREELALDTSNECTIWNLNTKVL